MKNEEKEIKTICPASFIERTFRHTDKGEYGDWDLQEAIKIILEALANEI